MSLGLREAGFDIVQAYDAWATAVKTYNSNMGAHAEVRDLGDLLSVVPDIISIGPDMIVGGPPCQDYSSAGHREEAENAKLTIAFAMIVALARPRWFMMENVTRALGSDSWRQARAILTKAGYGLTESKVNASRYGVPQNRRRVFVIGRLGERHDFLSSEVAAAAAPAPMSLRELFGAETPSAIYFPARSGERRSVWSGEEPAPTIREGNIRPLPVSYRPHPDDAALILNGFVYARPTRAGRGVRSIDEPYPTVTRTTSEPPGPKYLSSPHPGDPIAASDTAVLSVVQISRVQGFPDWWVWEASTKRDVLQMIANAVPAPLARTLGRIVLAREAGHTAPAIEGRFLQWLNKRGRSKATSRNVKAAAGRARRLLGGRSFSNPALELAELEATEAFQKLRKGTQSDLRQALRLLDEYLAERARERRPTKRVKDNAAPTVAEAA